MAPARGPRRWSFSLRACVTVARRCRPFLGAMVSKQSHHLTSPILTGAHALASSPLSPCFAVTQVGNVSPSHTTARLAPAAIVAPPMQIIASLPNFVSWVKRTIRYTRPAGEPCQPGSRESPMSKFNQSAIYPRVFPETPREAHSFSHCPPAQARPPEGFSLPQIEGPACSSRLMGLSLHPPIRALRIGSDYGMIFRHP